MNKVELSVEEQAELQRKADTEKLLARIREMSFDARRPITTENLCKDCELEKDYAEGLIAAVIGGEGASDIFVYQGVKQDYFYVYPQLAHNYVRSIALSEENNIANTVLTLVRYDSKTYPRPTKGTDFAKDPYRYTLEQVKLAVEDLQKDPANGDLKIYISRKGTYFLYSTQFLSFPLARKLAEDSEDMSLWY